MIPIISVSKCTLIRVVLVLLCISVTGAVYSQRIDCGEQYNQLIKLGDQLFKQRQYKKAFEVYRSARGCVESDIQLIDKKLNAVLDAVDKERETADLEKKKAQELEAIALNESIMAQKAKKTSDSLLIESEKARTQLLEQQNYMRLILDSLGKFDSREQALIKFNQIKEKADTFYARKQLDSAYYAYLQVRAILDENPLIRIGKGEIYSRIDQGKSFIDNTILARKKIHEFDSLILNKQFNNFGLALEILFQLSITKQEIPEIPNRLESLSNEIKTYLSKTSYGVDSLHLLYLLIEVHKFSNDSQDTINQLINKLKKHKKYSWDEIQKKYKQYNLQMHYEIKGLTPKEIPYLITSFARQQMFGNQGIINLVFSAGFPFGYKTVSSQNYPGLGVGGLFFTAGVHKYFSRKSPFSKFIDSYSFTYTRRSLNARLKEDTLSLTNLNSEIVKIYNINKYVRVFHDHFNLNFNKAIITLSDFKFDRRVLISAGLNLGLLREQYPTGFTYYLPLSFVQENSLEKNEYNYPALQKSKTLLTFGISTEFSLFLNFDTKHRTELIEYGFKLDSHYSILPFSREKNNIPYMRNIIEPCMVIRFPLGAFVTQRH